MIWKGHPIHAIQERQTHSPGEAQNILLPWLMSRRFGRKRPTSPIRGNGIFSKKQVTLIYLCCIRVRSRNIVWNAELMRARTSESVLKTPTIAGLDCLMIPNKVADLSTQVARYGPIRGVPITAIAQVCSRMALRWGSALLLDHARH